MGRQAEEQEARVASEGGGEDEGGEGDAVGDQVDWEVTSATWANNVQLSSRTCPSLFKSAFYSVLLF